jgi:hypothetical protein
MGLRTHFLKAAIVSMSFIILFLGASANTYAAAHYVDNAANGANNGSAWRDAWESFASINWSMINPGDTIYISGGSTSKTYNELLSVNDSGSNGNPITIDIGAHSPSPSGHSGQVRIDGQSARSACVNINGNYITVKNLYCEDGASNGMRADGQNNVIVEGNTLHSIDGSAIDFHDVNSGVIRGNTITTDNSNSAQTDGIVIYSGSSNITIEKNWIKLTNQIGGHNDCIQSNKSSNLTIRWNYCENTKADTADAQGVYTTEMTGYVKVYGNVINVTEGPVAIANRNLSVGNSVTYILNNTVKCGGYRCIRITEDRNPIIKNNIIWQIGSSRYTLVLEGWSGTAGNIDGNLHFNPNNADIASFNGSGRTWSEWKAQGFDAHGFNTNPSLDASYRPDKDSDPSVGKGQKLAAEYDKGLQTTNACNTASAYLPVATVDRDTAGGSAWDIGAYEYSGSNSDAEEISPPTNLRIIN